MASTSGVGTVWQRFLVVIAVVLGVTGAAPSAQAAVLSDQTAVAATTAASISAETYGFEGEQLLLIPSALRNSPHTTGLVSLDKERVSLVRRVSTVPVLASATSNAATASFLSNYDGGAQHLSMSALRTASALAVRGQGRGAAVVSCVPGAKLASLRAVAAEDGTTFLGRVRGRMGDLSDDTGSIGRGNRLTNSQAGDMANRLGYRPAGSLRVKGQQVFTNGKDYIVQDVDSHLPEGLWKGGKSYQDRFSKGTRSGTYDYDLNRVGP